MKVKKQDIINSVAEKMNCSKVEAESFVDSVLETISDNLEKGHEVGLVGFGTFHVQHRKERQGRNPQTGEPMKIAALKSPAFRAGKTLKENVNK